MKTSDWNRSESKFPEAKKPSNDDDNDVVVFVGEKRIGGKFPIEKKKPMKKQKTIESWLTNK